MGLTKQYLRYEPANIFGLIATTKSNIKYVTYKGSSNKYVAVGACEFVFIWDLKKNEIALKLLADNKSEVTCLAQNPKNNWLAVGYLDGSIRLFDLKTANCVLTFNGHKSSISCLNFDQDGVRLVSGGKDTDIVLWDLVAESGLFRLKGHKGMITQTIFMKNKNILVTCSKDQLVKFWDLDIRHCFKTLVKHGSEVMDLFLINDQRLITGCHDNQLRVFKIEFKEDIDTQEPVEKRTKMEKDDEDNDEEDQVLRCTYLGSLTRESKEHVGGLVVDQNCEVFASHANEKHVEIYKINSEENIKKRLAKKIKKQKRKLADSNGEANEELSQIQIERTVQDEYTRVCLLKTKHKIKSCDLVMLSAPKNDESSENICLVSVLLQNNQLEIYKIEMKSSVNENNAELVYSIESAGHRTDVRTISFSSDSTALLTASGDSLKIWNRLSLNCIRTLKCDYACSSLFLPDDNHVLIGCKSGKIQLFDINGARMLENVEAHQDNTEVWSLCMIPDKNGFVSGGADHQVKFWSFQFVDDEELKTKKRLSFTHYRTLQLDDDVLSVKISPNNRLISVALLDSTVKVFFMDTLKLFLNLYGHKQPVLSMDISFDNKLIVTGSADRNIKIWGLDFGDCHRSLFAHEDSIMSVSFVGKTHYVFTAGKDGKLKEWDADKFERIITLDGHLSEIWSMAVSHDGKYVITGSHDKSLRLWERTLEPLILEDERENENDKKYESELGKEEQIIAGETNQESGLATIKTIETIKSAEKIIEALDIYVGELRKDEEYQEAVDHADPQDKPKIKRNIGHPLLIALGDITAENYVLDTLKKTKSSEIETSLLVLDFEYVKQLLVILSKFLEKNFETELVLKCILFLLK